MATKNLPKKTQAKAEMPEENTEVRELPSDEVKTKEMPQVGKPENTVVIGGELIEIKPMKLLYQRNRTAVFYHVLEAYPLPDILAMGPTAFGDGRDGDKALLDWLVAATDHEELIRAHYDEITSETVYRILSIFRRVNKIDELEEKRKNLETPGTGEV